VSAVSFEKNIERPIVSQDSLGSTIDAFLQDTNDDEMCEIVSHENGSEF
jgi:hypothetical protein